MADLPPRVLALALDSRRGAQVINYAGRAARAGIPTVLVVAQAKTPPRPSPTMQVIDLLRVEQRRPVSRLRLSSPARKIISMLGREASRSAVWRRRVSSPRYQAVRPFLHWRALRRQRPRLELSTFTHVLIGGTDGWPVAWHVAKANPDVAVVSSIDVTSLVPS